MSLAHVLAATVEGQANRPAPTFIPGHAPRMPPARLFGRRCRRGEIRG